MPAGSCWPEAAVGHWRSKAVGHHEKTRMWAPRVRSNRFFSVLNMTDISPQKLAGYRPTNIHATWVLPHLDWQRCGIHFIKVNAGHKQCKATIDQPIIYIRLQNQTDNPIAEVNSSEEALGIPKHAVRRTKGTFRPAPKYHLAVRPRWPPKIPCL